MTGATITDITNNMVDIVNANGLLSGIDTDDRSSTSTWFSFFQAFATFFKAFNDQKDADKESLTEFINSQVVMTNEWLREQVIKFQYGDAIQLINYKPTYLSVDADKQIIEFCAVNDLNSEAQIKVRRKDTDTLSPTEIQALTNYINKIIGAGVKYQLINLPADQVKLYYTIIYDPQYNIDNLKTTVEDTITNYIDSLTFDSRLIVNEVTDLLQAIPGVKDPQFVKLEGKSNAESTYVDKGYSYLMISGYGTLVDASSTINYSTNY